MKLKTKDLLTLGELSAEEFDGLINSAIKLKKQAGMGRFEHVLENKTLAMIFQKPSTRTRVSFETGMFQLGGHAVSLSPTDMQLSRGESVEDTAKTLSRYNDCILARVYEHSTVEKLAEHAAIPVINGLSDSFHPCQILADFMTIKERKKSLKGLKMAWVGDGNNVCNSMIYGAALAGITMSIATPSGFEPDKNTVRYAGKFTEIEVTTDPSKAVRNADVVATDTFTSIHNLDSDRAKKFLPAYQVNAALMRGADKDAIFMHCLPAKRGREVTADVIDGPQSAVWDEAENRLHTQKALLTCLISS